jgi:hypothetical protein
MYFTLFVYVTLLSFIIQEVSCGNNDTFSKRMPSVQESSLCPNFCNDQGVCITKKGMSPNGVCSCFPGFYGVDCSQRTCPGGIAWADYPSETDVAHGKFTECSNMGICDRTNGKCTCKAGFGGPSCDIMLCPTGSGLSGSQLSCSNNGRCISLRDVGRKQDYVNYFNSTEYYGWDADMIYGCDCFDGYEGKACERRSCPRGDDPDTTGVSESQLIDCTCTTCNGGLTITYKGEISRPIPFDASEEVIRRRIMEMTSIEDFYVRIAYGNAMCTTSGGVTKVTFRLPHGDVPDISVTAYGTLAGTINVHTNGQWSGIDPHTESARGTRESIECSNRGICDYDTGTCSCVPGFTHSDGFGNIGNRGDCGYRNSSGITYYVGDQQFKSYLNNTVDDAYMKSLGYSIAGTTDCPFTPFAGICSGHGICNSDKVCNCHAGYSGVLCDSISCPQITTWWGDTVGGDVTHLSTSECGGIGTCDGTTGKCYNCGGSTGSFDGNGCEILACPIGIDGSDCNGNGYCRSMSGLTEFQYIETKIAASYTYANPWDANMIHGCACMRSPAIDGRLNKAYNETKTMYPNMATEEFFRTNGSERFYRGPYSYAFTDYTGYACAMAECPRGDNPSTRNDKNEIQSIRCTAIGGHFLLSFRENTTLNIGYNDDAATLAWKLEQIYTIHQVDVSFLLSDGITPAPSHSVCTSDGSTYAHIEFLSEHGNLPMMTSTVTDLYQSGSGGTVAITSIRDGTKEDVECSGQGLCNYNSGICECLEGYGSSNTTIHGVGNWGDCTFRTPFT